MGKKVKEYKSGDFIFAKVKGYPAWPARVQKPNGKKYFVYFYGTGETANLPPNMIFDYVENKDKFLTKTVKRRDFNDGVKQIEYDFANNVPLEEVIGVPVEAGAEAAANDTANDSAIDATMDDSAADTTQNDTNADDANVTQTDAAVEDSDDAGPLVIDEGKTPVKGKKSKPEPKAKETPKAPKTPRGKGKKEEPKEKEKEKEKEEEKTDEELVSRSGRKIRPKRYMDEQTEDNATLPSPAAKRRRASPAPDREKDAPKDKDKDGKGEKTFTQYNVVKQSELEGLKKPFETPDEDKENILIAYLPNGAYAGIRVFQARPKAFKNEAVRLQWDKQAARNALTLKMQLEREHITPQSVAGQLVMELNLTDEEKATLDKERETEEKKSRVHFLKTEMKLIELDAKIKTCLCLEKADTELCLKLLDELLGLEVKPLMLLKHPTCLETVKRMRAYVGNTPSWDLSESDALHFSKQAHSIRKQADALYKTMKEHFEAPEGLSFWEYFSERVLAFKRVTASLHAGELLELVHEPAELSQPNEHTMRAAIDSANSSVPPLPATPEDEEDKQLKKKTPAKSKKPPPVSTPSKSRRTRNKKDDEAPEQPEGQTADDTEETQKEQNDKEVEKEKTPDVAEEASKEAPIEADSTPAEPNEDVEMAEPDKAPESVATNDTAEKETQDTPPGEIEANEKTNKKPEKNAKEDKSTEKNSKKDKKPKEDKSESVKDNESEKSGKDAEKKEKRNSKDDKNLNNAKSDKNGKESEKSGKESEKSGKESEKSGKESEKGGKEKEDKSEEKTETDDKDKVDEPRAKRSRESKKTEPPPRSPAKRKSKF